MYLAGGKFKFGSPNLNPPALYNVLKMCYLTLVLPVSIFYNFAKGIITTSFCQPYSALPTMARL